MLGNHDAGSEQEQFFASFPAEVKILDLALCGQCVSQLSDCECLAGSLELGCTVRDDRGDTYVCSMLQRGYFIAWSIDKQRSLFSRALKLGLKLRMIISILTVCAVPLGVVLMYTPDYWCGWAAVIVVERVFDAMGLTAVLMQGVDEGSGVKSSFRRDSGRFILQPCWKV